MGSGKSSLLLSLFNETVKFRGQINIDGQCSFVSQQVWLQNSTLRENILFGLPFDKALYERVISACDLNKDILILPAGHDTEIGEKGINLSGD